ncbi:MAG: energy transducer TonB [Arcobacteraceae bacterium]|nr:energy transducer TonB [Arcobacteraceae bacterium]
MKLNQYILIISLIIFSIGCTKNNNINHDNTNFTTFSCQEHFDYNSKIDFWAKNEFYSRFPTTNNLNEAEILLTKLKQYHNYSLINGYVNKQINYYSNKNAAYNKGCSVFSYESPYTIFKNSIKVLQYHKKNDKIIESTTSDKELVEIEKLDSFTQENLKLYGSEYFKLSEMQKIYLKKNLKQIGHITQKYLRYPPSAINHKQSGINVIEFILKPSGKIFNLKIIDSSNYSVLDKNSLDTIKIAHKEYPRPKEDTLIKIFVRYILIKD